ncbi:hypothetical protein [uncultured Vibrio sp.]|uniref:hypothetical protein n=1 Tax=uncultured Vibrio sp. TaxID=114054 RepID=UPI00091BDAF7|nr:hypothetical protein [uncultured Vibrio sp.]OIQ26429.1 MAG: hypothetical protein BM561_01320 [Vibrio sp. MedPE-SWchi]
MKKDVFGICLSKSMLSKNLNTTFTHVRAYQALESNSDVQVMQAYPQLSGKEVLSSMRGSNELLWRAEFSCNVMK